MAAALTANAPIYGQDTSKWNVEIPAPIVREIPAEPLQDEPAIDFEVLSSKTKQVYVKQAPEISDLPPIEGTIRVTIQKVADPGLPDPPPPLPVLPPTDPAVIERMKELRETYRGSELVFVSASVHLEGIGAEKARTLLRIYPNGKMGEEVVAWSNVNFLHLTGQGGYRVTYSDGTQQDIGILMGISPIYGQTTRKIAAKGGRGHEEPEIPSLPDLVSEGPAFVGIEGYLDSPAMDVLEQLHDLFRKSGDTLKAQYLAREKALAERKAYLLANPPKPEDVTISFWKKSTRQTAEPAKTAQ